MRIWSKTLKTKNKLMVYYSLFILKNNFYHKITLSPQNGPIKILHIDDDEDLQMVMKLNMEILDPELNIIQFSDGLSAIQALDNSINCIITDYKMPNLDGLELSRLIREKWDIPIIIFTGQGSEEVASEAFAIGVNSYIQKSIDPSIFEILIKEIRNHHERNINSNKLVESEHQYRTFLENSLDGVTFNVDTVIKYCNRKAAELLGYSRDELIGMNIDSVTHPESMKIVEERTLLRQKGENVPEQYEARLLRKDGSSIWVEFHSGLIEFEGEYGSLTVIRDITERINYEHRLELLSDYTSCLNQVDSLESLYQTTYEILDVALGFKVLDIIAVKDGYIEDVKRSGESKEVFHASLDGPGITVRAVNTRKIQLVNDLRLDQDYLSGTRTVHMLSELAVPVFVDEKVFLVLNVESDKINAFNEQDKRLLEIFARNMGSAIERLLHLETILKQNQEIEAEKHRTRFMIDNSPYITSILDLHGKVKYVNKMFSSVLGFSEEEIVGKRYSNIPTLQAKDVIKVMKILLSLRRKKVPEPFSMKFVTKNGDFVEMKIFIQLYRSLNNETEIIVMARIVDDESLIHNSARMHLQVSSHENPSK